MSTSLDDRIIDRLSRQHIETQSWGYVSTGTRYKVFHTPGTPRDVREKIDDAALVHRLTGVAPSVALHIPWDRVDDYVDWLALRPVDGNRDRFDQPEPLPRGRLPARLVHER